MPDLTITFTTEEVTLLQDHVPSIYRAKDAGETNSQYVHDLFCKLVRERVRDVIAEKAKVLSNNTFVAAGHFTEDIPG